MRPWLSLLLLCSLTGAVAAQSPHVVVTPGVSHAWFSVIYQGSIYFHVPIFQSPFQSASYSNGKVNRMIFHGPGPR